MTRHQKAELPRQCALKTRIFLIFNKKFKYLLLFGVKNLDMKKVCLVILILIAIVIGSLILPKKQDYDYDYLRIHIRANSNLAADQNIKYEIKDELVEFLTPYLCNTPSKQSAINTIENLNSVLVSK